MYGLFGTLSSWPAAHKLVPSECLTSRVKLHKAHPSLLVLGSQAALQSVLGATSQLRNRIKSTAVRESVALNRPSGDVYLQRVKQEAVSPSSTPSWDRELQVSPGFAALLKPVEGGESRASIELKGYK